MANFEVSEKRMENRIVTRQHLDARHLKSFIESKILEPMIMAEEVEDFCDMVKTYQKENFQYESIVFRILELKAQKKLAEIHGMDCSEYETEISHLEEIYAREEDTKIKNLIEKIKD